MHKRLDEKLCKDFPLLYSDRNGDIQSTCMCWGFEVRDGWYQLLYDLSSKLEPLIAKYKAEMDADPNLNEDDKKWYPRASQVKEKFGTLCFYMTSATDEMYQLISEAENRSAEICETCGKPGKLRSSGWIACQCDECAGSDNPSQDKLDLP